MINIIMEYACEHCDASFSKLSNLTKHKRTAKYCSSVQQEYDEKRRVLTCQYCKKILSRSDSLNRHHMKCLDYKIYFETNALRTEISNLERIIKDKDTQIRERDLFIKELLAKISEKPGAQINVSGNVNINMDSKSQKSMDYPSNCNTPDIIDRNIDYITNILNDTQKLVSILFKNSLLLPKENNTLREVVKEIK